MKLALVGNQNAGKTTLFNVLTGTNQKVGNWPGVTIERKEGHIKGTDIVVVDLPGIYSLSPYTSEEEVSRKFVLKENPDAIINIVDATQIERSLYLTTQILETGRDVVIALNMTDVLEKEGIKIDVNKLEKELGVTIIPISAKKRIGIDELIKRIVKKDYLKNNLNKIFDNDIEKLIDKISGEINENHSRFTAVKIIERDILVYKDSKYEEEIVKLENKLDMDSEQFIASQRYSYIEPIIEKCVYAEPKKETLTDKIDKVLLNKWAAIPIFIGIMALVYILSVGLVGGLTVSLVDSLFNGAEVVEFNFFGLVYEAPMNIMGLGPWVSTMLENAGASPWVISLVGEGVISGVGAVLNFVPQIMILFICLSLLETTGYMSRIAFFLDRVFHKFGLSGKSLIPFIVGSGCSVPGIMSSRTVEDDDEKKMTIVLTPFIPCSAKLPIISLFAGFFFPNIAWIASLAAYALAIGIILICGLIFKKILFKGHTSTFITELPSYKLPSFSYVARDVGEKTFSFIKRAGTIILLCSVAVWFLANFSWQFQYIPENHENSLLANFGKGFAWIFAPMLSGNASWEAAVSAIQGLVAKEQVVSSLEVIANTAGRVEPYLTFFDPTIVGPSAYFAGLGYMTFNLFSAPCFGAIGAMKNEFGSFRKTLLAILFQTGLAWIIASLIGSIGWIFF
jgi:ferrous iron transport protein B